MADGPTVTRIDPERTPEESRKLAMARVQLRVMIRALAGPPLPVRAQRAWFTALAHTARPPREVPRADVDAGGRPAERLIGSPREGRPTVLYLHGGAYTLHTPHTVRPFTTGIALAAGAVVYALHYRRAPEHPCPAAIDDTLAAYRWLIESGTDPGRIVIGGDSAGAGLTLATAVAIRGGDLPEPAALALISPWVDLTLSGETIETKAGADVILRRNWLELSASQYSGALPADDPRCSPLFADLAGLPPTLIQAGTEDMLASDSERIAEKLAAAGVPTELELYVGLWHDFQSTGMAPEAATAVERLGGFVAERTT